MDTGRFNRPSKSDVDNRVEWPGHLGGLLSARRDSRGRAPESARDIMDELLTETAVLPASKARSKKQLLQELASRAATLTGLEERTIFDVLLEREKLGSTGVGRGVAIPHGKLAGLDRVHGIFAKLTDPIEFDAIDDRPVDLVFCLLAPEQAGADHLRALARVSRAMRNAGVCDRLRGCENGDAVLAILNSSQQDAA